MTAKNRTFSVLANSAPAVPLPVLWFGTSQDHLRSTLVVSQVSVEASLHALRDSVDESLKFLNGHHPSSAWRAAGSTARSTARAASRVASRFALFATSTSILLLVASARLPLLLQGLLSLRTVACGGRSASPATDNALAPAQQAGAGNLRSRLWSRGEHLQAGHSSAAFSVFAVHFRRFAKK
jgi:hypothetical protein